MNVVQVENDGRMFTFRDAPERVDVLNHNAVEIFLELVLPDWVVGKVFMDFPVLLRFEVQNNKILLMAERYTSLEIVLEINADFVYGFSTSVSPPKGPATIDRLEKLGSRLMSI